MGQSRREGSGSPFVFYPSCLFGSSFRSSSSCWSLFVKVTLSLDFFDGLSSPTWAAPQPPPGPPLPTQMQTSVLCQRLDGRTRPKSSTRNISRSFTRQLPSLVCFSVHFPSWNVVLDWNPKLRLGLSSSTPGFGKESIYFQMSTFLFLSSYVWHTQHFQTSMSAQNNIVVA